MNYTNINTSVEEFVVNIIDWCKDGEQDGRGEFDTPIPTTTLPVHYYTGAVFTFDTIDRIFPRKH